MTKRYPGGYITKTAPTVSTTSAPGIWTMEQQAAYQKAGTWPFGGPFNYIEDVFSTYLYTGNGSTQTITNGIDLSGKGGLVWIKRRTTSAAAHNLTDTARGAGVILQTDTTSAQITTSTSVNTFNADGFFLNSNASAVNLSGQGYASWTFRKQPKFFDVVTYTGNGVSGRTVAHSLGSAPGCVIIKSTSDAFDWYVYHQSLGAGNFLNLNLTDAATASEAMFGPGNPAPSSTVITLGNSNATNGNGKTYVAYLFAHNAGGFGSSNADNVISCGSYTGTGAAQSINLGYEPQWVLVKDATTAGWDWYVIDNMRGFIVSPASPNFTKSLSPNTSSVESDQTAISPTATGFRLNSGAGAFNSSGDTYIYIAIRRGPMKTPTTGTSVFTPVAQTGDSNISVGFPTDFGLRYNRAGGSPFVVDRLRGINGLYTNLTNAESGSSTVKFDQQNLMTYGLGAGASVVTYQWQRAPGFMDVVCYSGNGVNNTAQAHNLAVAPEMLIIKKRSSATNSDWIVTTTALGFGNQVYLNLPNAANASANFPTNPDATNFYVGSSNFVNQSGQTYVAHLFASLAGVSKVGSYTGNGSTQTINCGFTGGARFVLIKQTDASADWFVYDTARGMTSGTDPYFLLDSSVAEVATSGSVTTVSSGFALNASVLLDINVNGGSYIFLAIA